MTDPDAIAASLKRIATPGATIAGLRRLTGGASLETWAYDECVGEDRRRLVLRRRGEGEGEIFETSLPLSVEASLLMLADVAGVPVAGLVRDCRPEDGLGEAYVVERVDGETLGRRIVADPEFVFARAMLGEQCGVALARIHAADPHDIPGLETLDAAATLDRYEAIYRKTVSGRPAIEAAIAWLRRSVPTSVEPTLVHGDFRMGNLMVDPERGLVAVLDWELAHRGDPAEDFGWFCVNSWRFGRVDLAAGGVSTLHTLLDAYSAAGGGALDGGRIRWWQAMGSLKWAVVTMMMYRSFASGSNRSVERALIGRRTSECEADLVALMRGGL